MNQPQQKSHGEQLKNNANMLIFFSRAFATPVEVMLHDPATFGERYLGEQAAVALVILFIFPAFFPRCDPTPILWFLAAYVVMLFVVRAATLSRRMRGGVTEHSYYSGRPLLMRLVKRADERSTKLAAEPILVGITGIAVQDMNPALGTYLVFAAVGLLVSVGTSIAIERRRALDLHDAHVEQRHVVEQFRKMRGD